MHTSRLGLGTYVVAGLPMLPSALAIVEAVNLYTRHNAVRCGGGLGWLGPALTFYATAAVAALATLAVLVYALIIAIRQRSWARVTCLVAGAALSALVAASSTSGVARALVGAVLGYGCSWAYVEVTEAFAIVLVAAAAGGVLVLRRRQT